MLLVVRIQQANTGTGSGSGIQAGPGIQVGPGEAATFRPFGSVYRTRTVTGSDGRYEINGLPSGSLAVVAIKRGVRIPVQRFRSSEGSSNTADFVIPN